MKHICIFISILLLSHPVFSQKRISKNMPDAGVRSYIAPEVVEFKPGYYYSSQQNESMTAFIGQTAAIKWQLAERFGIDSDRNGLIDLPNSPSYANPDYLKVTCTLDFLAPQPQDFGNGPCVDCKFPTDCIWYVNGSTNFPVENPQDKFNPVFKFKDEVAYIVRAELIFEHKGKKIVYYTPFTEIIPNDILIVALGDSYASGEGNPDQMCVNRTGVMIWADTLNSTVKTGSDFGLTPNTVAVDHFIGHRSASVWSAQAAAQLERNDPHTSVTYINLGSGGSEIEDLIERKHVKSDGKMHPYTQIDEAARIIKDRKVEALLMNIGGNNLGFQSVIMSYILRRTLLKGVLQAGVQFSIIENSINSGYFGFTEFTLLVELLSEGKVEWEKVSGLAQLPMKYDQLAQTIKTKLPKAQNTYLCQYPEIYNGCTSMLTGTQIKGDLTGSIDNEEIAHAKKYLLEPLNRLILEKCAQHNWKTVYPGDWTNHGECKPLHPFLVPTYDQPGFHQKVKKSLGNKYPKIADFKGDYKWCYGINESESRQLNRSGAAHPNALGHLAIAESFLSSFAPSNGTVADLGTQNRFNGDFNGDKKTDFLNCSKNGAAVQLYGINQFETVNMWLHYNIGAEGFWAVGDFNGDQKDDILSTYAGIGVKVFLSDGQSFQYAGVWTAAGVGTEKFWTVGDFNGDGKDDILRTEPNKGAQVLISTGYSFKNPEVWTTATPGVLGYWVVGNFDGEKGDDLMNPFPGMNVMLSTGNAFSTLQNWGNNNLKDLGKGWIVGDFDGNKKSDLAQISTNETGTAFSGIKIINTVDVALSTGSTFSGGNNWYLETPKAGGASGGSPFDKIGNFERDYQYLVGDFSGDAKTDIFVYSDLSRDLLMISTGGFPFMNNTDLRK